MDESTTDPTEMLGYEDVSRTGDSRNGPPRLAGIWDNGPSHYKNCQWSADGTTVIAAPSTNILQSFILPPDLLETPEPHSLIPYSTHEFPSSVYATALSPFYDLSAPHTTHFIASCASLPIRLLSPCNPQILASYPLINPTTEAYIAPHSLIFDTSGNTTRFFAGSESQISTFDMLRDGECPMSVIKTIPSRRKKSVGGGVGMKGIVSAMALSPDGVLAAGTFNRWVGLWDVRGDSVGVWQLGRDQGDKDGVGNGAGVTSVGWLYGDGRYLWVAERGSDGVGIWDVRGSGKRLVWLRGRWAETMQRLSVESVSDEVWAGGTDGVVRIWKGVGMRECVIEPEEELRLHGDAVAAATLHPSGSVLATCSGQRHGREKSMNGIQSVDLNEDSESSDSNHDPEEIPVVDNSIKIWAL